jgi:hypothetical protein
MIEFNPPASARLTHSGSDECALGQACDQLDVGHALSFMQRRLASVTSTKWHDAIVDEVSDGGQIRLTTIANNEQILLWHHSHVGHAVKVGDPVALHEIYHVLAVGSTWFNVSIEAF